MIKLPIFALGPPHRKLVAYDSANRLANLSLDTGVDYAVAYAYDTRGLLASVTSGDYASTYDYRANGQLASTVSSKLSTPAGDILRADRSYDAGARLLGVANTAANNDQAGVVYTLGLDDQRLTATEETGEKWDYGYDGLKQLVTAKKTDTGAVVVPPLDQSYTYDPMGNRRAYADQSASTAYTANNANQYTAVGGIASVYDANGNLLSDGVKNYTWDAENQLIAVTPVSPVTGSQKVEYSYDWRMRRTAKKSYTYASGVWVLEKTTGFKYHEWNPIEETIVAGSTTEKKNYVWGNDLSGNLHGAGGVGGLLSMKYNGDSFFYGFDGNGNVRALVKADGVNPAASAITARYAYDGFGKEVGVSGADAEKNSFRFSTKQLDAETGMNYYGYRFYAANAGRWINRDPAMEVGGNNIYCFVGNDALIKWDLNGLCDCDNPCKAAQDKGLVQAGTAGGQVCCNGIMTICNWSPGGIPLNPDNLTPQEKSNTQAATILSSCVLEHERKHLDSHITCDASKGNALHRPAEGSLKPGYTVEKAECEAYAVELDCIGRNKGKCNGDIVCEELIRKRIEEIEYQKSRFGCK